MTTPDARRAANGSGKITRDAVLAAALEIIDRDGADALSMRRLARALNRDPMILYRHAPNKAALLDGVAETVLAQLHVDSADPTGPASCAGCPPLPRAGAGPPARRPLIVTRPLATPLGLRPGRHPAPPGGHPGPAHPGRVQRTRRPAHLPGPVRVPARPRPGRAPGTHRQPRRDRRPAAARPAPAAGQRIPLLRGLAPVLAAYDGAAELERGLDILLTGLTTTLTLPGQARPPATARHPAS